MKELERKQLFSLANNSNGMTIVEVVIAAALMGGIALGVMQLSQNTQNMKRETGFSAEIMSIDSEVEKFLLNADVCYATLSPLDFSAGTGIDEAGTPGSQVEVPNIRFGTRNETTGALENINIMQEIHNSNGAPPGNSNASSMAGRLVFRNLNIVKFEWIGDAISGVDPFDGSAQTLRQAKLSLIAEFEKRPCAACGNRAAADPKDRPRVVRKFYTVHGTFDSSDSNNLEKCYSSEGNAVVTALKEACEGIDNNQDGISDMVFDEGTGECLPQEGTAACSYGGSYATGVSTNYTNPATGSQSCPPGFTTVPAGHFMRPEEVDCGKSKCYNFYQQVFYNCVKCRTNPGTSGLPISANGIASGTNLGASVVSGYSGCDGGACSGSGVVANTGFAGCTDTYTDAQCQTLGSNWYPYDEDGDGCDDTCATYNIFTGFTTSDP